MTCVENNQGEENTTDGYKEENGLEHMSERTVEEEKKRGPMSKRLKEKKTKRSLEATTYRRTVF